MQRHSSGPGIQLEDRTFTRSSSPVDAERVHGKTHRTRLKVFGCALLVVPAVQDLVPPGTGIARATAAPKISAALAPSHGEPVLDVNVGSAGSPVSVARSDFRLSAAGDMFAAQRWDAGRSRIKIAPRRTHSFRLTFAAPVAAVKHATLLFRSVVVPIIPVGAAATRSHKPLTLSGR
jgi:hypothetical protein